MPKMSYTDATINAVQDLIYALQNPSHASPLVTIVNLHKEALIYPADIFGKSTSPAYITKGASQGGAYQEKLQKLNQEKTQIKNTSQSKQPFTNA